MTVYLLLCFYDWKCEVQEVFAQKTDAIAEGRRMEQVGDVEPGNWIVYTKKVR